MRAVLYREYGAEPRLEDLPPPPCPDDGVVVESGPPGCAARTGTRGWATTPSRCRTSRATSSPASCRQVGRAGHALVRSGDRVTVPFVCGCGRCELLPRRDTQVCPHQTQPGFTGPGSFAELVAVHAADTNLVRLPDSLDLVTAASLGCRFATAYRALVDPRPGRAPATGSRCTAAAASACRR